MANSKSVWFENFYFTVYVVELPNNAIYIWPDLGAQSDITHTCSPQVKKTIWTSRENLPFCFGFCALASFFIFSSPGVHQYNILFLKTNILVSAIFLSPELFFIWTGTYALWKFNDTCNHICLDSVALPRTLRLIVSLNARSGHNCMRGIACVACVWDSSHLYRIPAPNLAFSSPVLLTKLFVGWGVSVRINIKKSAKNCYFSFFVEMTIPFFQQILNIWSNFSVIKLRTATLNQKWSDLQQPQKCILVYNKKKQE